MGKYDDWKGDELRDELYERGLSQRGKNADMRRRLTVDDNARARSRTQQRADEPEQVQPEGAPPPGATSSRVPHVSSRRARRQS